MQIPNLRGKGRPTEDSPLMPHNINANTKTNTIAYTDANANISTKTNLKKTQ